MSRDKGGRNRRRRLSKGKVEKEGYVTYSIKIHSKNLNCDCHMLFWLGA